MSSDASQGMLVLTCPTTGHAVRTRVAIEGDPGSMQRASETTICPACGKPHTWSVVLGEVLVEDERDSTEGR